MADDRLINGLNDLLADHAVYYQKLRNYHWNVKGPAFFQLHQKFEEMYQTSQLNVDAIAERVLALGAQPKSTLKSFLDATRLEEDASVPEASRMVQNLRADIETLSGARRTVRSIADELGDETTVNLLDDITDAQAQDAWMLRAWLG